MLSFNYHDSLDHDVCYVVKGPVDCAEGHPMASNLLHWIV